MDSRNAFEVVLVTYKSRAHVEELVDGWPESLPVAIVDNGRGVDGLDEWSAGRVNVRYTDGGGVGFARAANKGAFSSEAPFVVFVNPDCRPTVDDMQKLVDGLAEDPSAATHAATMSSHGDIEIGVGGWEPSVPRTLAYAVGLHKRFPRAGVYAKPRLGEKVEVDWVTGACMAVRTDQFRGLGGFDESFYVYSEDMSFGRRAREAGLREVLRPDVVVRHGAGNSGAPSLEMLRLRGASFANYVERYHPGRQAGLMRAAMFGGYLLRSAREALRGQRGLSRQYVAFAKGVAARTATVGGKEVAMERFVETSAAAQAAGDASLPFLFVTKEFGVPATSGGMLRTLAMVRWFAARGDVILVSPNGIQKAVLRSGELSVTDLRPSSGRSLGKLLDIASFPYYRSLGALRLCGDDVRRSVEGAVAEYGPFRGAVVDHTSLFRVAENLPEGLPVWLSTHNVESDLMAQRAQAESGLMKLASFVEAKLLRRLETHEGAAHPMIVCTEHDGEQARKDGTQQVVVARNGVTPPAEPVRRTNADQGRIDPNELLFTGALDWRPNVNGILWLLESPEWAQLIAERPDLILTVAGRNPSDEFRARVEAAPGARVMANVPSMAPLLEGARLGVAPLLEGSGSRIKLLEYVGYALPSVSTEVGASGLDNLPDGVIRTTAENAQAFCDGIRAELDQGLPVLSPQSVDAMLAIYGWDSALSPIDTLLD